MSYYKWVFGGALIFLLISFTLFMIGVLPSRWTKNPARPQGSRRLGIIYSLTGAMSPLKKESAYMHLPAYTAGIIFHLALFTAIINLFISWAAPLSASWYRLVMAIILLSGAVGGLYLFIKRVVKEQMRLLSNPDDYISNLLVTFFMALSCLSLYFTQAVPFLYLFASIMILYIPVSKLRHSFYFFSSRVALGLFYGQRGVWPVKREGYER